MLFMAIIIGGETIKKNQKIINTKFKDDSYLCRGKKRGWHPSRAHKAPITMMFCFLTLLMSTGVLSLERERETCVPKVSVTFSWLSPVTLCWDEGDTKSKPPESLSLSFTLIESYSGEVSGSPVGLAEKINHTHCVKPLAFWGCLSLQDTLATWTNSHVLQKFFCVYSKFNKVNLEGPHSKIQII